MPPWFRFYSETLNDRKIQHICRTTSQPKVVIVGAWATVLALANDSPDRGALLLTSDIPFTLDDLADELGIDRETTANILTQFQRFNMLHVTEGVYHTTNWNKRQFVSDDSTKRVRVHRERIAQADCNDDETLQGRCSNAPETETETDQTTETDTEADNRQQRVPVVAAPDADDALVDVISAWGMGQPATVAAESVLSVGEVRLVFEWLDTNPPKRMRDKFAFARACLRDGTQAPPRASPRRDGRRFIEGAYADVIEH